MTARTRVIPAPNVIPVPDVIPAKAGTQSSPIQLKCTGSPPPRG